MKLVLGTAQFGMKYGITNLKKPNLSELKKIKKTIISNKIKYFDTAENYGNSEKKIKKLKLKKIKIFTKITIKKKKIDDHKKFFFQKIEKTISRLGTKEIFCLLLHDVNDAKSKSSIEYFKCLKILKKKGLIKHYGVSVYEPNSKEGGRMLVSRAGINFLFHHLCYHVPDFSQ